MEHPADHRPIRRVVLPTEQDVEVLLVDGEAVVPAGDHQAAVHSGLHVCPACSSQLVAPVAWESAGTAQWAVTLQCPNCEWWDADIYDEELVELFDEELDRGTEALVRDLLRLMRANMEDDVERFLAALEADQIWPEDF
jgi:hypothetical protein